MQSVTEKKDKEDFGEVWGCLMLSVSTASLLQRLPKAAGTLHCHSTRALPGTREHRCALRVLPLPSTTSQPQHGKGKRRRGVTQHPRPFPALPGPQLAAGRGRDPLEGASSAGCRAQRPRGRPRPAATGGALGAAGRGEGDTVEGGGGDEAGQLSRRGPGRAAGVGSAGRHPPPPLLPGEPGGWGGGPLPEHPPLARLPPSSSSSSPLPPFKGRVPAGPSGGAAAAPQPQCRGGGAQRTGRALDAAPGAGGRQPSGSGPVPGPRSPPPVPPSGSSPRGGAELGAMSAAGGAGTAAGTATSALCLLLSLTAVAVCLLLGAKTAELQGRLAALEERGAAGPGPLLEALQPRLEQLLREVSEGWTGRPPPGLRVAAPASLFP